jgi:hypothetical protein
MTVESFGVQSVQAVATVLIADVLIADVLAAAIVLLGAVVLLAVGLIGNRAQGALVPIVLSRAAGRLATHRADLRPPQQRWPAALPSRAPPQFLHRPDRTPQEQRDEG